MSATRGPEWRPFDSLVDIQNDTTLVLTLEKPFDMRPRRWFSGDVHVHTKHPPVDYDISPEEAHFVGRCEDLPMMWCLDQEYAFTGGPHAVSDDECIIYYSTEYRNQIAVIVFPVMPFEGCNQPVREMNLCSGDRSSSGFTAKLGQIVGIISGTAFTIWSSFDHLRIGKHTGHQPASQRHGLSVVRDRCHWCCRCGICRQQ